MPLYGGWTRITRINTKLHLNIPLIEVFPFVSIRVIRVILKRGYFYTVFARKHITSLTVFIHFHTGTVHFMGLNYKEN